MTTFLQTVVIIFPNSFLSFYGIETVPIRPKTDTNGFVSIKKDDGSLIAWYPDGLVIKVDVDGTSRMWCPKPTLEMVVKFSRYAGQKKHFFQFHSDGSLTARYTDSNYYWSAPISGIPENGDFIYDNYLYNYHNSTEFNEYNDDTYEYDNYRDYRDYKDY